MLRCTHCRQAAVSRIPQKRKFCKMNQLDCRNHKFPGFHDFMHDAIRGISSIKFKCRGIQDALNIKEKFCPGFHDFSQFSCPGFHEKQQNSLPVHCIGPLRLNKRFFFKPKTSKIKGVLFDKIRNFSGKCRSKPKKYRKGGTLWSPLYF